MAGSVTSPSDIAESGGEINLEIIFAVPDMRLGCATTSPSVSTTGGRCGRYAASALKPGWLDAEAPVAAEQPRNWFRLNAATLRYTAR